MNSETSYANDVRSLSNKIGLELQPVGGNKESNEHEERTGNFVALWQRTLINAVSQTSELGCKFL